MRLIILDSNFKLLKNSFNTNVEVFIVNKNKTKAGQLFKFIKNKKYDSVGYIDHYHDPTKHHICANIKFNLKLKNDRNKLANFWKNLILP